MARGIVLGISSHPVDLHPDGRTVGPREWAENVDLDDPHNAQLIADGHLTVLTQVPQVSPRTKSGESDLPLTPSGPAAGAGVNA
jgi:hypothetical protein